jgi:5-epi-alpha-selinene synthase
MLLTSLAEKLDYPFETPISADVDAIEESTRQWVRSFDLLADETAFQRFCKINYGWMGARFFPYTSFERAALGAHWIAWLFTLDDEFDELEVGSKPLILSQAFQKFLNILRGLEPPTETPLSLALEDLRLRTLGFAPSLDWMERFIESIAQYFSACCWEAQNREQQTFPDLKTYLQLRQHSGGQPIVVALVELMEGTALPEVALEHEQVRSLAEMTLNLMAWSNDILSVEKELRAGDLHNLVLVLMAESALSQDEAFDLAIERHNQEMQKYLLTERTLPSFGTEADAIVNGYMQGLRALVRGTLDWTTIDAPVRYASENLALPKSTVSFKSLVTSEAG